MQVGDKVFLKPINNAARYGNKEIKDYVIKKIGRKYFEVWDGGQEYTTTKFHLDRDYRQVTNYAPDWQLYFSKQQILDEQEYNQTIDYIRNVVGRYGTCKLSLDQLREIKAIIDRC